MNINTCIILNNLKSIKCLIMSPLISRIIPTPLTQMLHSTTKILFTLRTSNLKLRKFHSNTTKICRIRISNKCKLINKLPLMTQNCRGSRKLSRHTMKWMWRMILKMKVQRITSWVGTILYTLERLFTRDMLQCKSWVGDISQLFGCVRTLNMILMWL